MPTPCLEEHHLLSGKAHQNHSENKSSEIHRLLYVTPTRLLLCVGSTEAVSTPLQPGENCICSTF